MTVRTGEVASRLRAGLQPAIAANPPTPTSAMAMPIGTRSSIIKNRAAKPARATRSAVLILARSRRSAGCAGSTPSSMSTMRLVIVNAEASTPSQIAASHGHTGRRRSKVDSLLA